MNSKFLFVLFITILYNGVTYASPAKIYSQELTHPETPTISPVVLNDTSKKIEPAPTPVPTEINKKETSAPLNHSEKPAVENATVHSEINNKTAPEPHEMDVKNSTQDHSVKNATVVIDDKNGTASKDIKNNTQPIDNKNVNPVNDSKKNETVPVDVHPGKNSSAVTPVNPSTVAPTVAPTVPISTKATTTTTTTVKATPATQSNPTTVSPVPTSTDKSPVEHNSPVTETHFHGASFVGGIVLTLGLTAIGFIAFKYYKSGKIDMNYRTL